MSEELKRTDNHIIAAIQNLIGLLDDKNRTNDISDNFHTFEELYTHRRLLTLALAKQMYAKDPYSVYISRQHADDSMFPGYFIVVFKTPEGDYSYHYELEYWEEFGPYIPEQERADAWDGHEPKDITRLLSL